MTNYLKNINVGILSLLVLSGCSSDNEHFYTVGTDDNQIVLTMGVDNSPNALGAGTRTRAEGDGANTVTPFTRNGTSPSCSSLIAGTKIRMRVEGRWNTDLVKFTDCTTQEAADDATYNAISDYSPMLYWDDFGTADPNNIRNREAGLAIYAVAVNGVTTAPGLNNTNSEGGTISDDKWGSHTDDANLFEWNTEDNNESESLLSSGDDLILKKDLIVSNNISKTTAPSPGNLTFDEHTKIKYHKEDWDDNQSRLIFKHVFSKITFKLKAADGFADYKFKSIPTVTLTRSKMHETNNVGYCYVDGNVNVKKCEAIKSSSATPKVVTAKLTNVTTDGNFQVVTKEVIVYPGTPICTNSSTPSDVIVAQVNADGNIYYIKADKIVAAIRDVFKNESDDVRLKTKAGYNYVFNITVNKTGINVSATVEDWLNVSSDEYEPTIDITVGDEFGGSGNADMADGFSFYRKMDGEGRKYSSSFTDGTGSDTYYKEETTVTLSGTEAKKQGSFGTPLYWPDHQTHYHFRGVYPRTGAPSADGSPSVVDVQKDENAQFQGIHVNNCAYESDKTSFPSNLLIGAPEIKSGTMCGNKDHISPTVQVDMSEHGICAREGAINMNFRYMMSQVVVNLSTSADGSTDRVNIDGNTEVEIENACRDGWIDIHTRAIGKFGEDRGYKMTTVTDKNTQRHDAIVPQLLTGSGITDLVFKITVKDKNGNVTDIYRATVKDIPVSVADANGHATGSPESITKWEAGKKYIYNLKVTKTQISITATITDWETKITEDVEIWL